MYKVIVNPYNNKKYSIFSKKGLDTLNMYINININVNKKSNVKKYLPINKLVGINSHPFVLFYFKNLKNFNTKNTISSVVLIGEDHNFSKYKCNNEKNCYNINDFQKTLFKYIYNMGCTLDVFIENYTKRLKIDNYDIYHSFVKTENSMLKSWKNRFIYTDDHNFENLLENKNGEEIKEYNNVYFHLIDLRYMFNEKLNIFVTLKILNIDITKIYPNFDYENDLICILTFILYKENTENNLNFQKGKFIINTISNEIDQLIANKINTYKFIEFINLYKNLISIIIKFYKNDKKFIDSYIESVRVITLAIHKTNIFETLDSLLMDIYTINKMFNNIRKNILFYGGGWHTMVYCEFINQYYEKSPDIKSKNKIFNKLVLDNFNYECGT